ncbi:hypothetical protein ES319_A10G175700v1 [Gossypium barbadense]|uniref:MADS-box domain-containing protein n=2 Tax=Gossypium TaxID=3633 RepID=A0A5J5U889_GOSBA|nr:hypothetical protein ES319_A10G175700v1 [Gossypium barbadense]TYG99454.1 hypothetical protein ES288_A10G196400v1 [Gossypium darwinii]
MTRKKVKLTYITNNSARKATYKNRMKGLTKKMSEMSTLCGVDTCAIMYSPYKSPPEVWPSPMGVQQVLSKLETIPEMEKSKNMLNQKTFLSQKITKAAEQLKNHCKENWEKEITQVIFNKICGKGVSSSSSSSMVALPPMTMVAPKVVSRIGTEDIVQPDVNNMDPMQRQQWIMELVSNNNNPQTHVGADEMMFQFCDNINPNSDLWSNVVFPWEK